MAKASIAKASATAPIDPSAKTGLEKRATLRERTIAALDELIRKLESGESDGLAEQAARYERLAKLVAARKLLDTGDRRVPVVGIIATGALAILIGLHLAHRDLAEVDAQLRVTSLDSMLKGAGVWVPISEPERVEVSGQGQVELPNPGKETELLGTDPEGLCLSLDNAEPGTITLMPANVAEGSRLRFGIEQTRAPTTDSIWVSVAGKAELRGRLLQNVSVAYRGKSESRNYLMPVGVTASGSRLKISTELPTTTRCLLCDSVGVAAVAFIEDDLRQGLGASDVRTSVRGGSLQLVDIATKHELRRGEHLTLTLATDTGHPSELRQVRVDPQSRELQVDLHAWVSKLQIGASDQSQSLMPTWLEYLLARRGPDIIWGALGTIVAAYLTVKSWFKPE